MLVIFISVAHGPIGLLRNKIILSYYFQSTSQRHCTIYNYELFESLDSGTLIDRLQKGEFMFTLKAPLKILLSLFNESSQEIITRSNS